MKRLLLSWAAPILLIFFGLASFQAQAQCSASDECFDFRVNGVERLPNQMVRLSFTVKTNCGNDLSYAAFELPAGAKAANPKASRFNYGVENGTNSPFYSVKFEGKGVKGYKDGAEDTFTYELTNAQYASLSKVRVQAKAGNTVGTVSLDPSQCGGSSGGGDNDTDNGNGDCVAADDCFQFTYKGAETLNTGMVRVVFQITTNCGSDLSYAAFELPAGAKASNATASNYKYTLENGTNSPFYSLKFEGKGIKGYKDGMSDTFSFEVTAAEFAKLSTIRVQAKAGQSVGTVSFDSDGCDGGGEPCPAEALSFTVLAPDTVCNLSDELTRFEVDNVREGVSYEFLLPEGFIAVEEGNGFVEVVAVFEEEMLGQPVEISVVARNGCGQSTRTFTVTVAECEPGEPLGNPLPVSMTRFEGVSRNGAVELGWATASETNNDRFEVERSNNAKDYAVVGQVRGGGNSSVAIDYSFTDASAPRGTVYYRLRQVDLDGSHEYSRVIAVNHQGGVSSSADSGMSLFPNPTADGRVTVKFAGAQGGLSVKLTDLGGKVLHTRQVAAGSSLVEVDLSGLNLGKGLYLITVSGSGQSQTQRLMVR